MRPSVIGIGIAIATAFGCGSKKDAEPEGLPPLPAQERIRIQTQAAAPDPTEPWLDCAARRTLSLDPSREVLPIIDLVREEPAKSGRDRLLAAIATHAMKHPEGMTETLSELAEAQLSIGDRDGALASAKAAVLGARLPSGQPSAPTQEATIRALAILGDHAAIAGLATNNPNNAATAAAALALGGQPGKASEYLPVAADASTLGGRLDLARAHSAIGNQAELDQVVNGKFAPHERSLVLLRAAQDATHLGRGDVARALLTRSQTASHQVTEEREKISQWLGLARLWQQLDDRARASALLEQVQLGADSLDSLYRAALLGRVVDLRAAAGDTDGALELAKSLRGDALADMGPYPIAMIQVLTRRGDFPGALTVQGANTIAPDGYALAIIVLRYVGSEDKDPAFEAELSRVVNLLCPPPAQPTHSRPTP